MALPLCRIVKINKEFSDDFDQIISNHPNLKNAVVFDLQNLNPEEEKEFVGLSENYINLNNYSFNHPYPIYILTNIDQSLSDLNFIKSMQELPRFYSPKEIKLSIKESQLLLKTKLLQQEIKNTEENQPERGAKIFAKKHKTIQILEEERTNYLDILTKLKKKK